MSRYIDADAMKADLDTIHMTDDLGFDLYRQALKDYIDKQPTADVVEMGIITCFGIKFVVEDDIIKVKWRHGDKHYIVPFGGLLALWEMYKKEQEHGE